MPANARELGELHWRDVDEAVVASAATCDIGAANRLFVEITGTTTITSFGTVANAWRKVHFSGNLTLTHNGTSLILPGGANLSVLAGATLDAKSDGSGNWRVYNYQHAGGEVSKAGDTMSGNLTFDGDAFSSITATRYVSSSSAPTYLSKKARGTHASPAVVNQNDQTGLMRFQAYDGSTFRDTCQISITVTEATPGAAAMGSRLRFSVTPAGSVTASAMLDLEYAVGFSAYGNVFLDQNRHLILRQYANTSLPTVDANKLIGNSSVVGSILSSDGTEWFSPGVLRKYGVTANTSISVPAGWAIDQILYAETAGNAVTGGVKIGTTSGATDVVAAQAVSGSSIGAVASADILKKVFSRSAAQSLFIQAVTSWNSASVEFSFALRKVF